MLEEVEFILKIQSVISRLDIPTKATGKPWIFRDAPDKYTTSQTLFIFCLRTLKIRKGSSIQNFGLNIKKTSIK